MARSAPPGPCRWTAWLAAVAGADQRPHPAWTLPLSAMRPLQAAATGRHRHHLRAGRPRSIVAADQQRRSRGRRLPHVDQLLSRQASIWIWHRVVGTNERRSRRRLLSRLRYSSPAAPPLEISTSPAAAPLQVASRTRTGNGTPSTSARQQLASGVRMPSSSLPFIVGAPAATRGELVQQIKLAVSILTRRRGTVTGVDGHVHVERGLSWPHPVLMSCGARLASAVTPVQSVRSASPSTASSSFAPCSLASRRQAPVKSA